MAAKFTPTKNSQTLKGEIKLIINYSNNLDNCLLILWYNIAYQIMKF